MAWHTSGWAKIKRKESPRDLQPSNPSHIRYAGKTVRRRGADGVVGRKGDGEDAAGGGESMRRRRRGGSFRRGAPANAAAAVGGGGGSLLQVLTPPSRFQFCYLAQHWPCRFWPKACPALATSIPKILAQRLLLASIDGWCWKPRWNFHVMLMPPGNRRSRITNYVFYYCFVRGEGFLEVRKCSSLSGNSTVSLKFLVKFLHF